MTTWHLQWPRWLPFRRAVLPGDGAPSRAPPEAAAVSLQRDTGGGQAQPARGATSSADHEEPSAIQTRIREDSGEDSGEDPLRRRLHDRQLRHASGNAGNSWVIII